jgi:hypothetical protein
MKTSNIILLSFFGIILLSITVILFAFSRDANFAMAPDSDDKSGNAEQQLTLPHFNKIDIESRFYVHYTQDTFQKVVVKADSNLIDLAVTEVNNGKLFIHSKKRLRNRQHIDVYVTTDSINEVKSSAGGTFKTSRKMKVYQFDGLGSAGAVYEVDGDITNLKIDFSAGCVGNFSGNCKNLGIESSAGSVINAGNLVANKGNVSSSAGSVVNVNVTGELSVHASSGSVIKCQGNPQIKNIDISSGAQFIK